MLGGLPFYFPERTVQKINLFDERNLIDCKHLSVRGSSFILLHAGYMCNLLLIDIAHSYIEFADLRKCTRL